MPFLGYSKTGSAPRQTFQEQELQRLFASPLFTAPTTWKHDRLVSDMTMYWLFLLGLTTGARLEGVGQAMVADVKTDGTISYIDIDYYAAGASDDAKSIKTATPRRLVPVHAKLIDLGFRDYIDAVKKAGHTRLFPDLVPNGFGKRTKEASRIANRIIDVTCRPMPGWSFTASGTASRILHWKPTYWSDSSNRFAAMPRPRSAANTFRVFA